MSLLAAALRQLRAGGGRTVLSAFGLLLAGAMAGAAVTVAFGLGTGFDRSVQRSDLPDVVARFAPQPRERMDALVAALPNVAARSYRVDLDRVDLSGNGQSTRRGSLQLVDATERRGYAVVAGRDLRLGSDDLMVEQGLADAWDLQVGDPLRVFGRPRPITGITVAPDNVAFPLASAPRVYGDLAGAERRFGRGRAFRVDQALIWTRDPARTDITLQQARATTATIPNLRFITVSGVRVLIDQAAGIVIALLGAFSLIALGAAGIMLASQAAADVQRRLASIGVQRAIGVPRGRVAGEHALAAALLGLGAGGLGVAAGAVAVAGPADALLRTLNEASPGAVLLGPLLAVVVAITALTATAAATPAWRAAGRQPVALLRGAELRGPARGLVPGAGPFALGARLVLARRGRALLAIAVLAAAGAVVLLMLGLATLVVGLRDDPGSVGKRYALTVDLPPEQVPEVRALPGVADAAPRYVVQGADSFSLGEPVKLVALPGDHTRFENPPIAEGRRLRGPGEAEIGLGLASALGIAPGGVLAVQLPGGGQARFRVVGTVRALDDDGRIAYVQPPRVLAAAPGLEPQVVVRLDRGADRAAVADELRAIGARPTTVGGATTRSGAFLDTLAGLLRVVAVLNALVCLYALVQALGLVARERRPTLALLRATGASAGTIRLVLLGAALALAVPAVLLAVALEHWVLAPLTGQLAASYADLAGGATLPQAAAVVAAFLVLAVLAALRVASKVVAEPPVAGLREE
jgi:predicted lysophospholipase L1 biosynthesis ABC-type transport system permease subunit